MYARQKDNKTGRGRKWECPLRLCDLPGGPVDRRIKHGCLKGGKKKRVKATSRGFADPQHAQDAFAKSDKMSREEGKGGRGWKGGD